MPEAAIAALHQRGWLFYTFIGVGGVRSVVKRMIEKEDLPVIIQADQAVPSGLLVRVIDEAKLAGAQKISLATRKGGG